MFDLHLAMAYLNAFNIGVAFGAGALCGVVVMYQATKKLGDLMAWLTKKLINKFKKAKQ